MPKVNPPTEKQLRNARTIAAHMVTSAEYQTRANVLAQIHNLPQEYWELWMEINQEEYERRGGRYGIHESDRLHNLADAYTSNLIAQQWVEMKKKSPLIISPSIDQSLTAKDFGKNQKVIIIPYPHIEHEVKCFYVDMDGYAELLKANQGNPQAIQYLAEMLS